MSLCWWKVPTPKPFRTRVEVVVEEEEELIES